MAEAAAARKRLCTEAKRALAEAKVLSSAVVESPHAMISVHRQLARLAAPWFARSQRRAAETLWRFAHAEQSSALIMRRAASHCTDARRAALYLRHAIDEERHARMFVKRARSLGDGAGAEVARQPLRVDADDLFLILGETRFLAMVHRGEARGRREFESYVKAFGNRGDKTTAKLFEALIADERRHESYTAMLLTELVPLVQARNALARRIVAWEIWRRYRQVGRAIAQLMFSVIAWVSYALALPWGVAMRLRAQPQGWRQKSPSSRNMPSPTLHDGR